MNVRGLTRLVRLPNLVAVVVFQVLLQYGLIVPQLRAVGSPEGLGTGLFVLLVLATVCIAGGGNAINDYFDVTADRVNRPGRVVVGGDVCRREALLVHVVLTLVGVFAGGYVSYVLRREAFLLMFVGVPMVLWFYSTHFKRQFLVGNIVVALLVALTGYIVVSADFTAIDRVVGGPDTGSEPLSGIWYMVCGYCMFAFLTNLGREIIKDMEDAEGDRAQGCHTLVIDLGERYSKVVVTLIEVFTVVMMGVAACEVSGVALRVYICVALILPTLGLMECVWSGRTNRDYHRASVLSKVIMMLGVVSIVLI